MRPGAFADYIKSIKRLPNPPKSFFPNICFVLMRTERRHNNQAVFKVPPFLNKFDIANYLTSIYGVRVMHVQTINAARRWKKNIFLGGREKIAIPAFKKAYVTLDHDFAYPPTVNLDEIADEAQLDRIKAPQPNCNLPFLSKGMNRFMNEFDEEEKEMKKKHKSFGKMYRTSLEERITRQKPNDEEIYKKFIPKKRIPYEPYS